MDLHRFEFFCEDRNVARITRAISGLALPQGFKLQPVVNAEKKGEKIVASSGGTMIEVLVDWFGNLPPGTKISLSVAREFLTQAGFAPTSASKAMYQLTKLGILRKAKGRHGYSVAQPQNSSEGE